MRQQKNLNLTWLAIGWFLWGLVIWMVGWMASGFHYPLWEHLLFLALVLLYPVMPVLRARRWNHMNSRRQALLHGDTGTAPLAAEQPTPNPEALPLPYTIRLKPRLFHQLVFCLLIGGALFLAVWGGLLITNTGGQWWLALVLAGVASLGALLFGLLPPKRLVMTTYGLEAPGLGGGQARWRNARLFIIREGGKPGTLATHYELTSDFNSVEWTRMRRVRWYSLHQPILPFEEYDRQMEALLSLIAAKTNLSLYDAR